MLEECDDLDSAVLRLLTQALARELRVDLFGFDVLIESKTKNIFVVDVNVLPGFKGTHPYTHVYHTHTHTHSHTHTNTHFLKERRTTTTTTADV